jgi:hypothetical protein
LHFSADGDSIAWRAGELDGEKSGWDRVKKIIRTPKGFLLCVSQTGFYWIPFHAFFALDGANAFAGQAQGHTSYSEIK